MNICRECKRTYGNGFRFCVKDGCGLIDMERLERPTAPLVAFGMGGSPSAIEKSQAQSESRLIASTSSWSASPRLMTLILIAATAAGGVATIGALVATNAISAMSR